MKIKAILMDFDGTALQNDQVYLSMRSMYALRRAMDAGVLIIPCTGRCEDMFPPQIAREKQIRYWVTSSGTRVVDHETGEVIFSNGFSREQSVALCSIFENQDIYCEVAAGGYIYMERAIGQRLDRYAVPPHHVWFVQEKRQRLVDSLSDHFRSDEEGIEKLNFYGVPDPMQRPLIEAFEQSGIAKLSEGAGKDIQLFPRWLDRNKAVGILLRRLGIDFSAVMSIGDSELDLSVIEKAGIGVAMGNAPDWLKDKADYVTDRNDEDGMAKAIEKIVLS
ncbi:MAG: HAD hydrolase family protein [Eubacteriales bacterium]|nr:HAD hydrolase family protein [Eubacteriales bacterium]